jgi:hypothetical protein
MKRDNGAPLPGFVSGEWIAALAGGLPSHVEEPGARILQKHGLDNVAPDEWYPMESFLAAIAEIAEEFCRITQTQGSSGRQSPNSSRVYHLDSSYLH